MFLNFLLGVIRFRKWIFALAGVWAIVGIWAAVTTPIDALPDISENQVLVYTPWPNHNPPEIHDVITRPLSKALRDIPGMVSVRGSSDVGFSLLYLIFDPAVRPSIARQRVSTQLAKTNVTLPNSVQPELAPEGTPTGQIVWYTLSGRDTDLLELRSWHDQFVAPRLRDVEGVAEVASVGGFRPEVHVEVDSNLLASAGLSLGDVEHSLSQESAFDAQTIQSPPAQSQLASVGRPTAQLTEWIARLEDHVFTTKTGRQARLGDIGRVSLQPAPRYGVFERDGNEMVGGVVHMQAGENPLKVTRSVLAALRTIGDQLPRGFHLVPCYDRVSLISGAVSTVTRTLLEALVVTTVCIVLVMRHFRTSLVITLTLPLAVLGAFLGMQALRFAGMNIHANIMSLAGMAISIGVLVDASVVIVENVTFQLKREFGDQPIIGNTDELVANATAMVARPAVLAVLIMLVSFLPVFALGGIDGQLIRPLAWTKTLTLVSVVLLTVTLVPALSREFIRGRLRSENESKILRSVIRVYRPVLLAVCQVPWPFVLLLGSVMVLAVAATGNAIAMRIVVVLVIGSIWITVTRWHGRLALALFVMVMALVAQSSMRPIGVALRLPLDEGMVMDMPITVPRMTVSQAADDLKARNMLLCRFPEIQMVTGKAGRAETAFDPAPIDMIESMVEFRPMERWPRRRLLKNDARRHAAAIVRRMIASKLVETNQHESQLVDSIVESSLKRFDAVQRELCWNLLQAFENKLGRELTEKLALGVARLQWKYGPLSTRIDDLQIQAYAYAIDGQVQHQLGQQLDLNSVHVAIRELVIAMSNARPGTAPDAEIFQRLTIAKESQFLKDLGYIAAAKWLEFVRTENQLIYRRAGATWTQIVVDELCFRQAIVDPEFERTREQIVSARFATSTRNAEHHNDQHVGIPSVSELQIIDPHPVYDGIIRESSKRFEGSVWLWPHDRSTLSGPSGELDSSVQMPGWANVWTRPIQNRIDMLASGVSSEVGVRVLGDDFDKVVLASEQIASTLRQIHGAADVIADPIRGKDYVAFEILAEPIAEHQLDRIELEMAIQAATFGYMIAMPKSRDATDCLPLRLKILSQRDSKYDGVLDTPLALHSRTLENGPNGSKSDVKVLVLRETAQMRQQEGPATVKSSNGQFCNYVRLNVRGRDATDWVQQAKEAIKLDTLPSAVTIQWTGQFEHAVRTRTSLLWMLPFCFVLIVLLLLLTFRDIADSLLMFLSIPGALAGAVLTQWGLGYSFSLAVGVGYLACFGMAAATSMVMIIYLRQALADAGGLQRIASIEELRSCVIDGAVHRLRPKLLTEATMIFSLAPLLWSTGVGADVIRPMAAPVLGGILVADEVVDLLIPAMFFAVRRRRWLRISRTQSE